MPDSDSPRRDDGDGRDAQAVPTLPADSNYALLVKPDGSLIAANEAFAKRMGKSLGDLVGGCIYELFPPAAAAFRRKVVEEALEAKTPRNVQDVSRSGNVLEVLVQPVLDAEGEVHALAVFVSDVTGHWKMAHERLRMATAVEQAVEAVILIETDYTISFVNQAFEAMTGYSQSEVRGRSLDMLYQGRHQKQSFEEIRAALEEGEVWSGRTFNTVKGGRVIRVEKTVSLIRGRGGVLLGAVSIWRDVTREAVLERQLRQAQKMEAIGTLAGGIAHDFNNILGPIILHSELGMTMLPTDSPVRRGLDEILAAANRAKALVEQILALSRRHEADEPVCFRLSSIVKECVKFLRPSLPATIDIVTAFDTESDSVLADPTHVHQVVMNLCTNAAHAMRRGGGTLTLQLTPADWGSPVHAMFPESESRHSVLLTIRDTGEGMAPDVLDRIFDPFFTTKKRGGTGLGLAVVHNIVVSRLSGSVRVESVPGRGTAFHVLLPRERAACEADPDRIPPGSPGGSGERILFAEDEAPMREGTSLVLGGLGYEVTACGGPLEALERFKADPGGYDLVLADVTMPGMTGAELLSNIRRQRPDIPALLVSGYSEIVTPELLRELRADYLRKPYSVEALAAAVSAALHKNGD